MTNATSIASGTPPGEDRILDALVIGAGFAGLYQLYCLRERLGLSVQLLEAGAGVGGTWYWNRYPGARCDSESHSYCYSFSEDLTREWQWSERYPGPAEIMRYLNHVADRFDLKRDIRFDTRVIAAHYDQERNIWHVSTGSGDQFKTRFLITAVGCLSSANVPKIPGLDSFEGDWYHTGQWPHDGVDFSGKRVGQVGTGSTGIQAAPVIAETAGHLTVFQRTANYSVPGAQCPADRRVSAVRQGNVGADSRIDARQRPMATRFMYLRSSVSDTTPEERLAMYEAAWERAGCSSAPPSRTCWSTRRPTTRRREFIKDKIRSIVKDPATAAHTGRHRPPLCGQAAADRHRLLRNLQPRQRHAGRRARDSDRRDHAARRRAPATRNIRWTSSSSQPASMP